MNPGWLSWFVIRICSGAHPTLPADICCNDGAHPEAARLIPTAPTISTVRLMAGEAITRAGAPERTCDRGRAGGESWLQEQAEHSPAYLLPSPS